MSGSAGRCQDHTQVESLSVSGSYTSRKVSGLAGRCQDHIQVEGLSVSGSYTNRRFETSRKFECVRIIPK